MSFLSEEFLQQKTSQELTMLLYEACERNIEEAVSSIQEKNFMKANRKFQRAIDILERLGAGLNYEAGIIAEELDALYNYMNDQLIAANLKKDKETAQHVLKILKRISVSWNSAMKTQTDKQTKLSRARTISYEQNMMYDK
ncbi:flagellar export chaperone FliS [Alteribacillus sp. JSM 102045]|uniref:flagellar export chaperone FliS n=1 Tax=Alteribacillus sp. JSM 102045 TaxID=1562101 RepID=UPI0035C12CAA